MRKTFGLLLISMLFLTGCTIKQFDSHNMDNVVATLLNKNINLSSQVSNGYKYYMPRGMRVIDNTSYNEKLSANGYEYYLYVDIVSYRYKKSGTYEINKEAYYSKKLDYNGKSGYLEINKINQSYFIEMMYNYAKIETFVSKDEIENALINATYILNSIKFNDKIIDNLFKNSTLKYVETEFKLFEPKRKEGNFLDYVNEFDQYEDDEDEDLITPNTNEETLE